MLNRRTLRIKAMQNLYAFYLYEKANYATTLAELRNSCIAASFPKEEQKQALLLLKASLNQTKTITARQLAHDDSIESFVAKAALFYKHQVEKDLNNLKKSLLKEANVIYEIYLLILQLLIEWMHIARKQSESITLTQQHKSVAIDGAHFSHNHLLQSLENDSLFSTLVREKKIKWKDKINYVESWYNKFLKDNFVFQRYISYPRVNITQENQILLYVVNHIIFGNNNICSFFNDLDLRWSENRPIVARMITRTLKSSEKTLNLEGEKLSSHWEEDKQFYHELVGKTIEEGKTYDALIAQKVKNWSVDRIAILDKIIIKLAVCEMIHFVNIPIKVSINEYIDIAKIYSTPKSGQFVNGLLDAIAATLYEKKIIKENH